MEIFKGPYFCPLCDSKIDKFLPLSGPLTEEYKKHAPAPIAQKNATNKVSVNRCDTRAIPHVDGTAT